jgi:hypothetical protein
LNSFSSNIIPDDYTVGDDFSYTLTYDENTRIVQSTFTVPSGGVSKVDLNVTLNDNIGNKEVCSSTLTSSSGTLSCTVPASFGNATVTAELEKDEVQQVIGTIRLKQDSKDLFGSNIMFLSIFLVLSLVGIGMSDSPIITGLFLMLGAIMGVVLNLVQNNGFIGVGATILWLLIALGIVIMKGGSR